MFAVERKKTLPCNNDNNITYIAVLYETYLSNY